MVTENSSELHSLDEMHKRMDETTCHSNTTTVISVFEYSLDQSVNSKASHLTTAQQSFVNRESLTSHNEASLDVSSFRDHDDPHERPCRENDQLPRDRADFHRKYNDYMDYIKESFDIGAVTLLVMHHEPGNCLDTIWVKIALLVLVFVQLVTPFLLFATRLEEYRRNYLELLGISSSHEAFCPNTADDNLTLALAFCVGGMYLGKVAFRLRARTKRVLNQGRSVLNESKQGGILQVCVQFDRFMATTYEALVYICNIGIVFMERGPFAMVLNALVVEFIVQLDDEAKEHYMQIYPPDDRMIMAYMKANNEQLIQNMIQNANNTAEISEMKKNHAAPCSNINPLLYHISKLFGDVSGILCKVACILIVSGVIFLPVCKPGTIGTEDGIDCCEDSTRLIFMR